jgi:hypothetical protein
MHHPGYKTTEHAITWAVIILGAIALFRGRDSLDRISALVAPAIASASYSQSRGRIKSARPFGSAETGLREELSRLFTGRIAK